MLAITNRKLEQQFVEPISMKKRIGLLAYELDLPKTWMIYPVISVAQLEPAGDINIDPFYRQRSDHPAAIYMESDITEYQSYKVERLLKKRIRRLKNGYSKTKYLVRWRGYGSEYDT